MVSAATERTQRLSQPHRGQKAVFARTGLGDGGGRSARWSAAGSHRIGPARPVDRHRSVCGMQIRTIAPERIPSVWNGGRGVASYPTDGASLRHPPSGREVLLSEARAGRRSAEDRGRRLSDVIVPVVTARQRVRRRVQCRTGRTMSRPIRSFARDNEPGIRRRPGVGCRRRGRCGTRRDRCCRRRG